MMLTKKKFNLTTTDIFKFYKNNTDFNAQNTENCISKRLDFKFFWGAWPQSP